jgi:type VI secretion system protein ImpK
MTPEFAKAIDPVFLGVLGLLDRIGRDEPLNAEEERVRIRGALDQAEAMLGQGDDWQVAKYGLVAWIDEVLIDASWSGRDFFREKTFEYEEFTSNERAWMFYTKAQEAEGLRNRDALEVFYLGVMLGFRGIYRDPVQAPVLATQHQLPADLQTWARDVAKKIHLGQGVPPLDEGGMVIVGAPPGSGPFPLIWALIGCIALLMLDVTLGLIFLRGIFSP